MKRLVLLLAMAFLASTLFGQKAYENKFNFYKKISPVANGVGLKTKKSPEIMQETIEKKFSASVKKAKAKKVNKNIFVFEGVVLPEVSSSTMDYYFKIEEVSKENYLVEMFLSLGNNNFISSSKFPNEMEAAKRFMEKLDSNAELTRMAQMIADQEEKIKDQEKEIDKLTKTQHDLVKSHEKMVEEIKKNEAEQQKVVDKSKTAKETLEAMQEELKKLQAEMKNLR
ncbi:MAG: coiled-coil domain-containing protein 22 [Bacteroidia bacterium]|nr:coiled-coil domain-containing protein 22 [Bacteroidia bacterium]